MSSHQPETFIKQKRSKTTIELIKHHKEFILLNIIAYRARRTDKFNPHGLEIGEALIGDYQNYGMSEQNYRTAKKNLKKWKFITCRPTPKGTIARLINSDVWDININGSNEQTNREVTTNKNTNTSSNDEDYYISKNKKKLKGKRLDSFLRFWEAFNFKQGKSAAADSWLIISQLTDSLVDKICTAAKLEAKRRPELENTGKSPKWPQGWLNERRWEDEINQPKKQKFSKKELFLLGYNVLHNFGKEKFNEWCTENKIKEHDKKDIMAGFIKD